MPRTRAPALGDPIGLAEPALGDRERELVWQALESPLIAYGPAVTQFEEAVKKRLGLAEAVAVSSGTAALHLALLAVRVQPGDAVLLPTLTFVAVANAVRYVGAEPMLFDVEGDYRQIDAEILAEWLRRECTDHPRGLAHRATGRPIGAVIAVDLLGHPADVRALRRVVGNRIPIVEDAAQAFGACANGRPLGAWADATCLSFNANKIVTSGGGGMVLSDSAQIVERARFLAGQAKAEGPEYLHPEVGFNYRLPSAAAALGTGQVARLEEFLERKRINASDYAAQLDDVPGIELPREAPWAESTFWLYTIHVEPTEFGCDVRALHAHLEDRGIESRPIFTPLHIAGVHAGKQAVPCPVAERLGRTGLMLPSSTNLTDDERRRVVTALVEARR